MGLINLDPTLHTGEEIRWRTPAARSLERRTVAGTLFVTSEGIVFMPNRLNRRRYIVSLRVPWARLTRIDTAAPEIKLKSRNSGGLRRRLRLAIADDEPELFVVNHPEQVAIELRRLGGV